jgi:hypothetical protein
MFSALWAITAQAAGHPLGQAAPYVYKLPRGVIMDITPYSSEHDVFGFIQTTEGFACESQRSLAQPLGSIGRFYSALYNGTSTRWYVLTFGTDSSLKTGPGWDNLRGVGTPNAPYFVNAIAHEDN